MIFVPIVELDVPGLPEDMALRMHNRFAKESLREAMQTHHRKNFRRHVTPGNRERYGHQPRQPKYREWKQRRYGRDIDLVKTGRSMRDMARTMPDIRIGGAAEGGRKGLTGSYRLRFAWKGGTGAQKTIRTGVSTAQMLTEMARWSDDEAREASANFVTGYWQRVEQWRGSRKRIRATRR